MAGDPSSFDEVLAQFAADPALRDFARPEAVLLAWAPDGTRLIWASPAAEALRAALVQDGTGAITPSFPARSRLRALGQGLAPSRGMRLERLRFDNGGLAPLITCACRRLTLPSGADVLLTAIVGRSPSLPRISNGGAAVGSAPPAIVGEPATGGDDGSVQEERSLGDGAAPAPGPVRFVWTTDAAGRFVERSSSLADVVGAGNADIVGRTWDEIEGELVRDPEGMVSSLFTTQRTWSGQPVQWRIGDTDQAMRVDLAATPRFGPGHDFLGFRGFGIFRADAVSDWASVGAPPSNTAEEAAGPAPASASNAGDPPPGDDAAEDDRGEAADTDTAPDGPGPEPRAFQHLSPEERAAFREIARALGARFEEHQDRPDPGRPTAQIVHVRTREPVPPQTLEILDRLPIGIVVHRGETVLFASRTLLDMVGYDSAASLAKDGGLSRVFPGRPHSASSREGGRAPLLLSTRRKGMLPVEALLTTVDWEGLPASALILRELVEHDTQRLRAMELDLRVREARLQELTAILDTAVDGVIVLDDSARILSLNRSAEALFGYDQKEVAGESVTILLAEESHSLLRHYLDGLRGNEVSKLLNDGREVVGRVRQGGAIPLFMTIARTNEAPRQFCAVLRDLTAFKKAEAELSIVRRSAEAANGQKSEFLNKVSHEVRTPLNAIIGFAEVMLEERFGRIGNDRYKEYLKNIHECGRHVVSLVNDLLDLAKIEAGRMELSFGGVGLNDIVAGCVNAMLQQATRDRIVVRTSFAPNLPLVVADERSMRQIVLNLISNAVKFTKAGGQVIVSTALTDRGEVAVRVRDTGVGMSEAEIEAALQPFRQISTAPKGGGTGLGLALAKSLIEANRATLHITSAPDEGTFVEVLFPPTRVLTANT